MRLEHYTNTLYQFHSMTNSLNYK